MADAHNVFISWSGDGSRSQGVALALREWLPRVLQAAKPWMSKSDIDKGTRGLEEVGAALEAMKSGIICLTPENLTAEWILFEAGALSKTRDAKTRVWTYLLGGLQAHEVKAPLGLFQATKAEKDDTRSLVHSINKNLETTIADSVVDETFDKWWPDLEKKLSALPKPSGIVPPKRGVDEIAAEILDLNRVMAAGLPQMLREDLTRAVQQIQQMILSIRNPLGYNFNFPLTGFVNNVAPMRSLADMSGIYGPLVPAEPVEPANPDLREPAKSKAERAEQIQGIKSKKQNTRRK
jgi:hypothetical protein